MNARWLLPLVVFSVACGQQSGDGGGSRRPSGPLDEGQQLLRQGQLDEALAQFEQVASADGLYYQGVVWARKAAAAPQPTPIPPPSPAPRGAKPQPAPEFKDEELSALALFEEVLAQQDQHAQAHLAIAELLAPHALRRFRHEQELAEKGKTPPEEPLADGMPDCSPDRVVQTYETAARLAPNSPANVDRLIEFASLVGRPDAANAAFQQLLVLQAEKPEPLIRYGDFLWQEMRDPSAAIERYREAMIWAPGDKSIPNRIGLIYVQRGEELYERQQFVAARKAFEEARKWIQDWQSEDGVKVLDYLDKLRR